MIEISVLFASSGLLAACDTANDTVRAHPAGSEVINECIALGLQPDSPAMQQCMQTDSRAERLLLADRETYGTF